MKQEVVRKRLVQWIRRSRLGRFLVNFASCTLTMYLIQYVAGRFGEPFHGWDFPILFGLWMGVFFAFVIPNSNSDTPRGRLSR